MKLIIILVDAARAKDVEGLLDAHGAAEGLAAYAIDTMEVL